jgi:hypothetical protein
MFSTVTDSVLLVVTVPKVSVAGDKLTWVAVPVSDNCSEVSSFGSPVKFAVTVPVIVPVDVGVKATLNVHVASVASDVFPDRLHAPLEIPVVFNE